MGRPFLTQRLLTHSGTRDDGRTIFLLSSDCVFKERQIKGLAARSSLEKLTMWCSLETRSVALVLFRLGPSESSKVQDCPSHRQPLQKLLLHRFPLARLLGLQCRNLAPMRPCGCCSSARHCRYSVAAARCQLLLLIVHKSQKESLRQLF